MAGRTQQASVQSPEATDSTMNCEVLVVGAGPVGLLTMLLLAKAGIDVVLVEALPDVDNSPRAMAYGPAAVIELERAGVAADARSIGMDEEDHNLRLRWINVDNQVIGEFRPEDRIPGSFDPVICGQFELAKILKRHATGYPNARILFEHSITDITEARDGHSVTATVATPTGTRTISAQYLAGCDGGRSTVRKLLGLSYDGFTIPQWLVACNVRYPFEQHGYKRSQFIVDPDHFCLIGRIDPSGLWRVSYAEREDLTREEVLANVHAKFAAIFPRGPKPLSKDDYQIEMVSPYRIHQRSAPSYRKGRSLLAGDAAHACAPFGGMGLTTGICDAAGLADTFIGVLRHLDRDNPNHPSPDVLLDKYADIRRQKYHDVTHKVSYGNTCRLRECSPDPEKAVQEDEFFRTINSGSDARRKLLESAYILGEPPKRDFEN
ncbi:hypothetical protein LTS17_009249 [Exophiala oligosperma]